jgi:hypothetical protein
MRALMRAAVFLLLAGCASIDGRGLVAGQSTVADVEAVMGAAADKRQGAGGETVYYYPRLPWGYATYAARIAPDGKLVALEQRLTPENTEKLKPGVTRASEVRDLLGPPYEPMKQALSGNEIWTYPMRTPGYPTPRWFLVHVSPEGVVRETHIIDDPNWVRGDAPRGPRLH